MEVNKTQPGSRKLWEPRFMKWLFAECPKYKSFSQRLPVSSQAEPEKCQRLQYFFERSFRTWEIVKWRKRNVANPLYQDHRTDWSVRSYFQLKVCAGNLRTDLKKIGKSHLWKHVSCSSWGDPLLNINQWICSGKWLMLVVPSIPALRARIGCSPPKWTAWAKKKMFDINIILTLLTTHIN